MIDESDKAVITGELNAIFSSPDFYSVEDSNKGLYVNGAVSRYLRDFNIEDKTYQNELFSYAQEQFSKYKNLNNITRYMPNDEDQAKLYEPISFSDQDTTDDKVRKIDEWRESSFLKASSLRPADSDDIRVHVDAIANEQIRQTVGNESGWVEDKSKRAVQAMVQPIASLFNYEGTERFFAEHFTENPEMDDDYASQISAGIGDSIVQVGLALGTGAATGPIGATAAITSYNAARMMKDSYKEEMKRSGNAEMALDSAINQIPSVLLESAGDIIFTGVASKLGSTGLDMAERFALAATDEAKKKILKEAIPTIGQNVLKSGISEATLGGIGAEFSSGYGSYLATGDEKYLKSYEDLIKSGIVEGSVGALFGGALAGVEINGARSEISKELTSEAGKQSAIFDSLKSKNYQGVIDILNNNNIEQSQAPEISKNNTGTGNAVNSSQSINFAQSGGITFNKNDLNNARAEIARYESIDPISPDKERLKASYERKLQTLQTIETNQFQSVNEFVSEISPNDAIFISSNPKPTANPKLVSVELEGNQTIPDDDYSFVFYAREQDIDINKFNKLQALHGNVNVGVSNDYRKARVYLDKQDGNGLKVNKKDGFPISVNPRKGWVPVVIYDGDDLSDSGNVNRKIKVLPKVVSFERMQIGKDFKYIDSYFDNTGTLTGALVEQNGKRFVVRGDEAYDIASKEREESIRQSVDKISNKNIIPSIENVELENKTTYSITDADVFDQTIEPAINSYNSVKNLSVQEQIEKRAQISDSIDQGIAAVENKVKQISGKEGANAYLEDLNNLWYYLSSVKERLDRKRTQDDLEIQDAVDSIEIPSQEQVDNNIEQSNQVQDNVNTEITPASAEGKIAVVNGQRGFIKINGPDAYLDVNGVEIYLSGKDFPLQEVEGFEGGAGLPFQKKKIKRNPPKAKVASENITDQVEESQSLVQTIDQKTLDATEDKFFNNFINIPSVSFNDTVSFLETLSEPEINQIANLRGLEKNPQAIAEGFGKRRQALFKTVREAPLSQEEINIRQRETDRAGDILTDQERSEEALLSVNDEGNSIIDSNASINTITGEIDRFDDGDRSYSISSESSSQGLPVEDVKSAIKERYGIDVEVVSEGPSLINGRELSWKGASNTSTNKVIINAARIPDISTAISTFRHEIAHLGYEAFSKDSNVIFNNFIKQITGKGKTVQDFVNELSSMGYNESQIDEEIVVKQVEDLLNQYDSTGSIRKFFNKIITWIKEKLGVKLSGNDINVIAERIFKRGLNQYSQSSNNSRGNQYSLDTDNLIEEDIFALVTNRISDQKKNAINYINKIRDKKIEAEMRVDEKPTYKSLMDVRYSYLNDDQLSSYIEIVSDFINTRSKVSNPESTRINVLEIQKRAVELNKASQLAMFEFLQESNPDILAGKDFENDFGSDISSVEDLLRMSSNFTDIKGNSEDHAEYIDKVIELQDIAIENLINDPEAINKLFGDLQNIPKLGDAILDKRGGLIDEYRETTKEFVKDYLNYVVNVDPRSFTSFRKLRQFYYNLLSITADGYPSGMDSFITKSTMDILSQQGIKFRDPSSSRSAVVVNKISSFQTSISRLGGSDATSAIYKMNSKLRESFKNAERFEKEIMIPYLNNLITQSEKMSGRPYNNADQIKLGIYAHMRQHYLDETPEEGLNKNFDWLTRSFSNYSDTNDKKFNAASKWQSDFLNSELLQGIDVNNIIEGDFLKMEANAQRIFDKGQLHFADGVVKLFDSLKPMSKFTSEFVYGNKFQEINNYVPSYSMVLKGGKEVVDQESIRFDMKADSFANGMIGGVDPNMNKKGMSSIKVRHRVLGDNRVLDLNINRLAQNRGRLNALDYFTAIERRQMSNVLNSNELRTWLGDPKGQRGRVDLFKKAHKQMWTNSVMSTVYLGDFHAVINSFTSRMVGAKLFSAHQLFSQTISNSVTFFIQNLNNPKKIVDFFKAYDFIARAESDPEKHQLLSRIISDIKNRSQDAILDRSARLDIDGQSIWQDFKKTNLFKGIRDLDKLREKIMFAPFRLSDEFSGYPMILAEFLDQERKRTGNNNITYDNMSYNEESYFKALDSTESMIGIGSASRRGEWMHNNNAAISMLRNVLTMFSSHRINNATNFGIAIKNLQDPTLSIEDKSKSARYMIAIAGQTAAFGLVKGGIALMIGQLIMKAARNNEDDDLEKLYMQRKDQMSPKEKESLQQEISMRRDIRKAVSAFDARNSSVSTLGMNILGDMFSNIHYIPAISDIPKNMILHLGWDIDQEKGFRAAKEGELERLKALQKRAKAFGDTRQYAKLSEDISDLDSQEYMSLTFEKRGFVDIGGTIGPFLSQNFDIVQQATKSLIKDERFGVEDWATLLGTYGLGSPDFQKYLNLRAKIAEATVKGEKNKEKARAKVIKDHNTFNP